MSPTPYRSGSNKLLDAYVRTRLRYATEEKALTVYLAAIGRFAGEGRVRPGLPYVLRGLGQVWRPSPRPLGALNWATGETVAIKEITLSNIPKSEIGQIMVRSRCVLGLPLNLDASRSPKSIC